MTPSSTYRVQLHAGFTFSDAAALVPHLRDLGVSHLYASPSLAAAPGSTHGYDVVDPGRLDDERGGEEGFAELQRALDDAGLGLVLDIVPNHVGLALPENRWWWSVLRDGPDSAFAQHFDLDWAPGPSGRPQLVWPVLGASFDEVVADGGISADVLDGELVVVAHGEHRLPTRPGTAADHGLPTDPDQAVAVLADDRPLLRAVADDQHWQLVHWQRGNDLLRHRRFFDVTTLGGVRVEVPAVFDAVHERVAAMLAEGQLDGLRVDHPDGLWDPTGYAARLRELLGDDRWLVFEKILEQGEQPRDDWPVDGTVGYSFLNDVLGLYLDPDGEDALTTLYDQLIGDRQDPVLIAEEAKREAIGLFGAELDRLTAVLASVADEAGTGTGGHDHARHVVEELVLAFPVYRTYVVPARDEIAASDHAVLDRAVAVARARLGANPVLDLLDQVLRLEVRTADSAELVHRFQQLTGPVMAKGVEDTTFYRYLRFVAANEVGGHPAHLGTSVAAFHAANQTVARERPATMLTTSTHDTKRAEDVRARLAVLTEMPDLWVRTVQRLETAAAHLHGRHGPSANHRYLVWQTLVGAWPIGEDRLTDYLRKAAREGKQETSWLAPDDEYEDDLRRFAVGATTDDGVRRVLDELLDEVVPAGRLTSLSQTLLRLTSPGVPDTYQGCELWDLSLVDPDNRRPVDHQLRARLLAELDDGLADDPEAVLSRMDEGLPKLHVVATTLRARRRLPGSFGPDGSYAPLTVSGAAADHLVAFRRGADAVVLAPRLVVGLGGRFAAWRWEDTAVDLPDGRWRDALTGAVVEGGGRDVDGLLAAFPVGLLLREDPS